MGIDKIDKNMEVQRTVDLTGMKVYDVRETPFKVYGLMLPDEVEDKFKRIPVDLAQKVSDWVKLLHANTAGGRVRFATNSSEIAIRVEMPSISRGPHFTLAGCAGLDLYADGKYIRTFMPPDDMTAGYESCLLTDGEMHNYTINMPSYCEVSRLYVMLEEAAELYEAKPYKYEKPIVYYGSSITQGGCANRPGNIYQNIISRRFDTDYINLGFSGAAKGEIPIAEYIAQLDMSLFVYDYDHNAPTPEHLEETHERMFKIIRDKNPELPIICVSRIIGMSYLQEEPWNMVDKRREIIKKTVDKAIAAGDKNVYFIDGAEFGKLVSEPDGMTVDGVHPTDLGFAVMAKVIGDKIEEILK